MSVDDKCGNCGQEMRGFPYCSNCGWQRPDRAKPVPVTMKLAGTYVGMLAAFGACGFAIYTGIGSVFGFGLLGNLWIVRVVALVVVGALALQFVFRRFLR